MKRKLTITGRLACMLFALALLWSCSEQPGKARKPKVVRKKITVAAKPPSQARKGPPAKAGGKAPAPRPRSDIAAAKPPRGKAATQKAPAGQATAVAQSALRPKSDIDRRPVPAKPADAVAQKTSPPAAQPGGARELPAAGAASSKAQPSDTKPGATVTAAKPAAKAAKPGGRKKAKRPPYNPEGKTDPFKPIFAEKPKVTRQLRPTRIPRTPLERIALSQLKLTAVILAPSGNRALVQEATGKGYVIQNGTYIGKNSGKVIEIKKDRVIIEEEFEDVLGKLTRRTQQLKLPKPAGGR